MTLSLLVAAPSDAAVTAVRRDDPPVKVWLNQDNSFQRGDRARVHVTLADDGYLVVLRGDGGGRVRVLFPLDPGDDGFVRGGNTMEIHGRGDREAFTIDEREGTGVVLAARSVAPFEFADYVRGDHWDYGALNTRQTGGDQEATLLDIAQGMVGDGHFDYDLVAYTVASPIASFGRPCYGCGSPYYDDGWPDRVHLGLAFGSGSCFDPFFFDPFFCRSLFFNPFFVDPFFFRPRFFNPFFVDPFFFRPVIFQTIIITPFAFRPFIFFGGRVRGPFGRPFGFKNGRPAMVVGPRLRVPPGALLSRRLSLPVRGHAPVAVRSVERREPIVARALGRRAPGAVPTVTRREPIAVRRPALRDPVMVRMPQRREVVPSWRGPDRGRDRGFTGSGGGRMPLVRDRGWSSLRSGFGGPRLAPAFRGGARRH